MAKTKNTKKNIKVKPKAKPKAKPKVKPKVKPKALTRRSDHNINIHVGRKGGTTERRNNEPAKAKGPDMTQMAMLMAMSRGGGGPVYIPQQAQQQQPIDYDRIANRTYHRIHDASGRAPTPARDSEKNEILRESRPDVFAPPPEYYPTITAPVQSRNDIVETERDSEKPPGGRQYITPRDLNYTDYAELNVGAGPYVPTRKGKEAATPASVTERKVYGESGRRRRYHTHEADKIAHREPLHGIHSLDGRTHAPRHRSIDVNDSASPLKGEMGSEAAGEGIGNEAPPAKPPKSTKQKNKTKPLPATPSPPISLDEEGRKEGRRIILPTEPTPAELELWGDVAPEVLKKKILKEKQALAANNQLVTKAIDDNDKKKRKEYSSTVRRRERRIIAMEGIYKEMK
jgi:hypothetical protein